MKCVEFVVGSCSGGMQGFLNPVSYCRSARGCVDLSEPSLP